MSAQTLLRTHCTAFINTYQPVGSSAVNGFHVPRPPQQSDFFDVLKTREHRGVYSELGSPQWKMLSHRLMVELRCRLFVGVSGMCPEQQLRTLKSAKEKWKVMEDSRRER